MSDIKIKEMTKKFGSTVAVDNVTTTIKDGDLVTLLGPSGCGKTTTLRCIAGLETPTSGQISLGDTIISNPERNILTPPEKRDMGMMFQSYAIWPHKTVYENIAYPLKISKANNIEGQVDEALEMVGISDQKSKYPTQLSGGQQQRVAFARAVINDPDVLLLDEPLSNLDAKLREHMRFELRELQQELGITAVYVTHNQEEAMVLSDEVIVMNDGKFTQRDSPRELYSNPNSRFIANFIGETNFLEGTVTDSDRGKDEEELVEIELDTDPELIHVAAPLDGLKKADKVTLSVRPQYFELSRERPAENALNVTVNQVTFLGMYAQVEVTTPRGTRLTINTQDHDVSADDQLFAHVDPSRIRILRE